jgi:hypothetical protein
LDSGHLGQFVESVVQQLPSPTIFTTDAITVLAKQSGIDPRHEKSWLIPCPKCNSNDTAVYRWNLIESGNFYFESSADNLPLRKKT